METFENDRILKNKYIYLYIYIYISKSVWIIGNNFVKIIHIHIWIEEKKIIIKNINQ